MNPKKQNLGIDLSLLFIFGKTIYALFWLFSALWFIIKWSTAPFILLAQISLLIPFMKYKIKFPKEVELTPTSADKLNDDAWLLYQKQKETLESQGFIQTQLYYIDNMDVNTRLYICAMINDDENLAVGLNYWTLKDQNGEYTVLDSSFMEYTLSCADVGKIDFHNNPKEHIESLDGRIRYYVDETDAFRFYKIVSKIEETIECSTTNADIDELINDFTRVIKEEFSLAFKTLQKQKMLYYNDNKYYLTWCGSWQTLLQEFWPLSSLSKPRKIKRTQNFLQGFGINLETIPYYEEETEQTAQYKEAITSLEELQDTLQNAEYRFGFSNLHKVSSMNFYIDSSLNIESVVVTLQEVKKFENSDRYRVSQYEVEFNNREFLCRYNGFAHKDYYIEEEPFSDSFDNISKLISIEDALAIAQEASDIDEHEKVFLIYYIDEEDSICEVNIQKSEHSQTVKINPNTKEFISIRDEDY